ncbi:MAG TPA: hypothetical protein VGP93_14595, partial [Polyangiaceae bacterium]|nr:hypothetical protein [Polyangiaceae bacterium]
LAAYVSQANECRFCYAAHRAVAERALGANVVDAVFKGKADGNVSPQLKATLDFVGKLARSPADVSAADADVVRNAGVSERGLETAIHICAAFCIINRLANSLGFEIPSLTGFDRAAKFLLRFGYEV